MLAFAEVFRIASALIPLLPSMPPADATSSPRRSVAQ